MRKIIVSSLSCIPLVACTAPAPADYERPDEGYHSAVCLDGVGYWYFKGGTHGGRESLAVRIDPENLKPVNCKSAN